MGQYRPQLLQYKLRRLFDSGHCSLGDFAWQLGQSKEYIEQILRGRKVNREEEFSIGKLLSAYVRRYPELRPEPPQIQLVTDETTVPADVEGTPRGVCEELECFEGRRVFKAIDGKGVCRARIEVCAFDIATRAQERRLKGRLEAYLDTVDPVGSSLSSEST